MNYDRRKFFTSIALGVGATAFPNFIEDFDQLDPVKTTSDINQEDISLKVSKHRG